MKEIGGYIELDTYNLPLLHDGAIALNCGRNALAYLIRAKNIKRLWIPRFICDSVTRLCERECVAYSLYEVGMDFLPSEDIVLQNDEWLYLVNYYSQLSNDTIAEFAEKYERVVVDNAQSYFQEPLSGVDTIYTCRKYFGVADGAFLYSDAVLNEELPQDESYGRMKFLLGRFERTAEEFYPQYVSNNELFSTEPIKRMSKLTNNLLHGIDYSLARLKRENNYAVLHQELMKINQCSLQEFPGTFMYPLMVDNAPEIRKELLQHKIYIPTLWPNVLRNGSESELSYSMAKNILPLPCDQRYNEDDMMYIISMIKRR